MLVTFRVLPLLEPCGGVDWWPLGSLSLGGLFQGTYLFIQGATWARITDVLPGQAKCCPSLKTCVPDLVRVHGEPTQSPPTNF